jgi:hypothetical protein
MSRGKKMTEQEIEQYKRGVEASFRKFMKGKRTEDIFPKSNKRALDNLIRAGLLKP